MCLLGRKAELSLSSQLHSGRAEDCVHHPEPFSSHDYVIMGALGGDKSFGILEISQRNQPIDFSVVVDWVRLENLTQG